MQKIHSPYSREVNLRFVRLITKADLRNKSIGHLTMLKHLPMLRGNRDISLNANLRNQEIG